VKSILWLAILCASADAATAWAQGMNVLYNFGAEGYSPGKGINMDSHGRIYGTTQYGGDENCDGGGPPGCGVVFRFEKSGSGWTYTALYDFTTQYSAFPMDPGMPTAANGRVYDVTFLGGEYSNGMVFDLSPSATAAPSESALWDFNSVYQFTGNNDGGGPSPLSPLVFDAQGDVYGAAVGGGTYNDGVIYELTPSGNGWTQSVLYNFTGCEDGAFPSGIVFDKQGNIYGTTAAGGSSQCGDRNGCGTVFKLSPSQSGWTESTLHAFQNGTDGCPSGPLFRDSRGNLYGITTEGGPDNNGGTVWELSPKNGSWSFSVLHDFNFFTVGYYGPYAPNMDAAGNLWGTVSWGGANETGVLFRLKPSKNGKWTFTDVYDFATRGGTGAGCYPNGTPMLDSNGNLYGVTQLCGADGEGTIWEYKPRK
jgi:uncharacterized repeat protein (TIGR03803 family)